MCPETHQRLRAHGAALVSEDGRFRYELRRGVPVFINRESQQQYLSEERGAMASEYGDLKSVNSKRPRLPRLIWRLLGLGLDHRSSECARAVSEAMGRQREDALCIAVGGGPTRHHTKLVNVNIDSFANVDVVADAYRLPYADGSVDFVFCEAVLEHLEFPETAVREMYRVIAPGGEVFCATPFLQVYHGYPAHFQNFTLLGHERLFARQGFSLLSSGLCVGPTFMLTDIVGGYISLLPLPGAMRRIFSTGFGVLSLVVRRLDRKLNRIPESVRLASTTYVHARKDK